MPNDYEVKYVVGPGFDAIVDPHLRAQLVDFGANSGPSIAIQRLQSILGVEQDGILGSETLAHLAKRSQAQVNDLLVIERLKLIGRIVAKDPSQAKFVSGWINRAVEFFLV